MPTNSQTTLLYLKKSLEIEFEIHLSKNILKLSPQSSQHFIYNLRNILNYFLSALKSAKITFTIDHAFLAYFALFGILFSTTRAAYLA